jgi:NADPH:quinone reductase
VLLKGVTVQGLEMRGFLEHSADDARRDREELLGLLGDGAVVPHVSATFALEDVRDALHAVANRTTTGKVIIEVVPSA